MDQHYNYREFAILYVDDEEMSLASFARAFEDEFRILTAGSAKEGWEMLQKHKDEIGLLMTDQRMPGEKGIWLLEKARQFAPRIIRILVTATTEYDVAIAAINTGSIYRYVPKPWDPEQLNITLKRGLEFFLVQRERDQLLQEKMSVLRNMMMADRIVSLGLLAAGLSHHIRNPLTAVKTFLDLAPAKMEEEKARMEGLRDPEFWKEYYQNAQAQLDKINNLLRNLWAASETSSLAFDDKVDVRQLVAEVLDSMKDELGARRISCINEMPADLAEIKADRVKLCRLFELMLKDELASLPEGAQIRFSAENQADGSASGIVINISDNGPGVPRESLRVLFDPFVVRTDSPMEYGINLMACYFIVHHHGGRITAESEDGKGTSFSIRLPVNPTAGPASSGSEEGLEHRALLSQSLWEKLLSRD
jgi:two-component system probable response regulator PhcQ